MFDAPSLRETLESAISASAEEAPEVAPEPVAEAAPEAPEAQPEETAAEAAQRARDEKGRFAPKAPEAKAAPEKPAAAKPAEPAKPAPAAEAKPLEPKPVVETHPVRAPQSWKPAVRELVAKLPAEFKPILEEVNRRESEITRTLHETAEARKTVEQVRSTLAPFEGLARANGMDSMQFAGSVLQTAAVLQMGTAQQKAGLVAQLIGSYGIDVDAVNAAMQGQAPRTAAPQPQDVGRLVQEELQRQTQAATEQRAAQAWQEFQASSPEFLADVQESMREILHLAGQQGRKMTYEQAYDRACKLDEGISQILASRKAAEAARAQAPTVARAKVAASSIKATPAAGVTRPTGPRSLREDIEAAIAGQRT